MILHLVALAPAAVGLCCLAADRRRARAIELGAALLMMIAMFDAAVTALVPLVWWAAVLVAGAMTLAMLRGRARSGRLVSGSPTPTGSSGRADTAITMAGSSAMSVHSAAGMVVMASLLLSMVGGAAVASVHHHGGAPALSAASAVLAVAYVIGSAVLAARCTQRLDRAQYVAMATSVGVMSIALVA